MNVSEDVMLVLDRCTTDGHALSLPPGQLDRKQYLAVNKVLEAAGGKWNRRERAHLFADPAAEVIDQIILTGQVVSRKQELGYFPTPEPVVKELLRLAKLEPGMEVLEPSAGRGAIASAVVALGAEVDCIEIDPANAAALADEVVCDLRVCDFLGIAPRTFRYDRVVMNPPFARQQDITHVEHALEFLKPDGLLVSVMALGVTFRQNAKAQDFRDLVATRGGEFVPLPPDAFKESGTGCKTVIAVIPGSAS